MAAPISVLHVEDDQEFADLVADMLERNVADMRIDTVRDPDTVLERIEEGDIDCVVSDYDMPGQDGIELLASVRDRHGDLPFILYTGKGSEEVASEAISAGVTDYLQKERGTEQYALLANRIRNAVEKWHAQRNYAELFEKSGVGVTILDPETGHILDANQRVSEILSSDRDRIVGSHPAALSPDEAQFSRDRGDALMARAIEAGEHTFEWRHLTGDGETVWVEVTLNPTTINGRQRILGLLREATARKEREAELRRKERRFEAVFNDPNILVGLIAPDGSVLDINDTAMDYVDVDREALVGESFWDTPWFEGRGTGPADVRRWVDRAADGEYVEFEADLRRPDGEPYTLRGVIRPVTDETGEVVSLLISDRDVTEHERRKQELERSNALLSTLFEAMPQGVLVENADREVLACNERLVELFDFASAPAALVGRDCEQLATDASERFVDPAGFRDRIHAIVDAREPVDREELRLADSRTFERSYRPIELPEGAGHLWVYADVSERVAYLETVSELQHRTEAVVTAPSAAEAARTAVDIAEETLDFRFSGVHLVDDSGDRLEPVAVTDGLVESLGRAPTYDRADPSREMDAFIWEVFAAGEPVHSKDVTTADAIAADETPSRSGIVYPLGEHGVFITSSPEVDAFDDEDVHLVELLSTVLTAVLDRIRHETELEDQTELLEAKTERLQVVARVLSHDLRSPLNAAQGRLELAGEECESEHLAYVERSLDRMSELIENMLTLAEDHATVTDPEPVAVREIAERCWGSVGSPAGELVVAFDGTIEGDPNRLKQVFENLFRNAIEHGSTDVTVTVGELEDGFYVEDDGPGIPGDARAEVFEAGYSTNEAGTGFGLTIVKEIVAAHGWEIDVTEGESGGTRFEVRGVDVR